MEAGLMSEIELINRAHADPEVRGLRRSSTRGGDESRHPAAEEARRTTTGGNGEVGVTLQQSALVAFNDLSSAAGKSRVLSEGLWGASLSDGVQQRQRRGALADGRGTGQRRRACLTCGTNGRCFHLLTGPVPAHLVQRPRSGRSNKHPTYSPLRCVCSRRGLSITCRCAQCSGGTQLHTMRSLMYFRTWWCKTASPMPQLWRLGLRQQTEEPRGGETQP